MDGNSFGALIGPSLLLLVVLGSVGVSLSGYQMADVKNVPKGIIPPLAARNQIPVKPSTAS
jgi:flagellar motor component MotA